MERARAVGMLALIAAAFGVFWSQASRFHDDPLGLAKPPFTLEARAWRSILTSAQTAKPACPASGPVVVMYVSPTCAHCHAEIERLAALVRTGARAGSCIALAIVAAPAKIQRTDWLPSDLVPMLVWDHDATVAHALRATLVPTTAFVTRAGIVLARVVGETDERSSMRRLDELKRLSTPSPEAR